MQDCPEEFDATKREAKFALFRSTETNSWENSFADGTFANSDPIRLQHWAVVIHFPEGEQTYLFEVAKDEKTGHLEAYRARYVDYEVFKKSKYFGTAVTSPLELLEKAKQIKSNGTPYNLANNNCQTWLEEFLNLVSPNLYQSLKKMIDELERPYLLGWTVGTYTAIIAIMVPLLNNLPC